MQPVVRPTAVSFCRLTDDDVRAMSVMSVTTSEDLRSNRMGGTAICGTCGAPSCGCGGHFGHIELPIAVPHPLFPKQEINVIPVPPTRVRIPNHGHDAPLTVLLRRVLRALDRRKRGISRSEVQLNSANDAIKIAVADYYSSADQPAGLIQRLRGKSGVLRQTLMGWRVNSCARAVVTPDPLLAPWEVGVPGKLCATLGLKDGDSVVMNRQPSLHRGSMMGHVVRVRPFDFCLSISPTVTPPYNADFDGDEMNLHTTDAQSCADARVLIGVEHNLLSASSGKPLVRLVQDACLATYLMTGKAASAQSADLLSRCESCTQAGAAKHLHSMQRDAHAYMAARGFSVGVDDFVEAVDISDAGSDRSTLGKLAVRIMDSISASNRVRQMVAAGSKGGVMNLVQMFGCVGFQTVRGKGAELPGGIKGDSFVHSSFVQGLTPDEFWMHACASREGMIQTAIKTADAGYLMRRMIKCFENIAVCYDGTVRLANGSLVQLCYGGDGISATTSRFKKPQLAEPGDAVGIMCAQAVGEKLTQLTLDTFHKAGVAFKHGLLRVKAILDASDRGALVRGAKRPYMLVQYQLANVVPSWQRVTQLPPRAWREARMRGIKGAVWYRGTPRLDSTGLLTWHVAAQVRRVCHCVSDEQHIYAVACPTSLQCGVPWAGSTLLHDSVSTVNVPPLGSWYASEPPIVAAQLGIEAARVSIVKELAPYMGGVDQRHIGLLADAMTRTGMVLGANRSGVLAVDKVSVLGSACFETAPKILAQAATAKTTDPLHAASSRLALGCIPKLGAHSFDVVELPAPQPKVAQHTSLLAMPPTKRMRFAQYM